MSIRSVPIGQFLKQVRREVKLQDNKVYKLLGVKWYGNGMFLREEKTGREIKAEKLYEVNTGDLVYNRLFAWKSSFAVVPEEFNGCLVSNEFPTFIYDKGKVDPVFLLNFILLPENIDLVNRRSGGMSSVSRKRYKEEDFLLMQVPELTIDEQKVVSEKIILKKEQINSLQTEVTLQSRLLSLLRQSILQEAIEGKLTAEWRKKNPVKRGNPDTDASALLEKIKIEKQKLVEAGKIRKEKPLPPIKPEEIPFELPEGWVWCRLGELCELITSGSRNWATYYKQDGRAKFIRMGNLSHSWFDLRTDNIQMVEPPKTGEGSRTALIENDLLISITGDVGWMGLIPPDLGEAYINQHTALVRFSSIVRGNFFPIILCSPLSRTQFNYPQRGIKNSFRLADISFHIIPLPPLSEQAEIVSCMDSLLSMISELEKQVAYRKEKAEQLMKAVLYEAFSSQNKKEIVEV